jgi:hypothetical protein
LHKGKLQTLIEDIQLPNPVIRSYYGDGFIKQYVRDRLLLHTEPATSNVNDYGVKNVVENLPNVHQRLESLTDNYLNVQQDILESFVDRGQLKALAAPTILPGGKRIPALKLDDPRQPALMHALVRSAHVAVGNSFRTYELHTPTAEALGCTLSQQAPAKYFTLGSRQIKRPLGFRHRAALRMNVRMSLPGRCSKKLLEKTTSRLSAANGHSIEQSC